MHKKHTVIFCGYLSSFYQGFAPLETQRSHRLTSLSPKDFRFGDASHVNRLKYRL